MATTTTVKLNTAPDAVYSVPNITQDSADRASQTLQRDFDAHHIFFNNMGFHNHIVHGVLTLFAIGASPEQIQEHFDSNSTYQRPQVKDQPTAVKDLQDPAVFKKHLGDENYYRDYVAYFQQSAEEKGWQQTLLDEIFKGGERADDMHGRFLAGLLHPIIHMGFGVEFEQPLIMAEAFGEMCVHSSRLNAFYFDAEKVAKGKQGKPLLTLLDEIRGNEKLRTAVRFEDDERVRQGVFERAKEDMINIAASYRVDPSKLEWHVAEMVNFDAYMTGGAQRIGKKPKMDFFFIHCLNCSISIQHFLLSPRSDWLPLEAKARLLEWKVRTDLLQYVSQGCPDLHLSEIESYAPRNPKDSWPDIFARANAVPQDDGHISKVLRSLAAGEKLCEKHPDSGKIQGAPTWLKLAHIAIDSTEDSAHTFDTDFTGEQIWMRGAGFEESWRDIGDKPKAAL